MTTKLITVNDIKSIKSISDNIDNVERLDPYIIEAQDLDIRPFLGELLFYDIATNPSTTPNAKLLAGGTYIDDTYTLFFDGLKIAIAYFAYARFIANQGINITRFGIVKKLVDNSEAISQETVSHLAGNARSVGQAYLVQVERFLDHDATITTPLYSLWRQELSRGPKAKVRITKVQNY